MKNTIDIMSARLHVRLVEPEVDANLENEVDLTVKAVKESNVMEERRENNFI